MAEPKPDGWPFLVVLTSAQGDRIDGLGCLIDTERVITSALVARTAERALLADDVGVDIAFDEIGEAIAIGRLQRPTVPSLTEHAPRIGPRPEQDAACTFASVYRERRQILTHHGAIGLPGTEGDFGVDIEEPIVGMGTPVGSPVLVAGAVVGVVHRQVHDNWVDAFALDEAEVHGAHVRVPPLAEDARSALSFAASILGGENPTKQTVATAVLLGALMNVIETTAVASSNDVIELLRERHPDAGDLREVVDLVMSAAGLLQGFALVVTPDERHLLDLGLRETIVAARSIARRTGSTRVHTHHVLASALWSAAVTPAPPALAALDITFSELRRATLQLAARSFPDEDHAAWIVILRDPPLGFGLAGGYSRDAVDPTVAIPLARDHLGVRDDATMLATVIAGRATPMPLSIGLFGEWGSGKSTFMGLMRGQVDALATSGGDGYHRNIRQIGFNAWHYADTNLWASLGQEIFEQLAGPGNPVPAQREAIESELSAQLHARKELEAATERAKAETARLSDKLDAAAALRAQSALKLARAAAEAPTVRKEVITAFKRLGISDEAEQGRRLAAELRGTGSDLDELRSNLPWLGDRGLATLAGLVAAAGTIALLLDRWIAAGGLAAVGTLIGGALWIAGRARSGIDKLRHAAAEIRGNLVQDELAALRKAEASEQVLQAQLDEVIGRVGELGRDLAELSPGRRLYSFVTERADGEDYRRHLGLISTVRRDFQQLIALMEDWRKRAATDTDAPLPIDRIVLYIDDLDRCSPRQVVDVLQAVHLLLALELFVVVVGVDPRWLLRSLQSQYDKLLVPTREEDESLWQVSPHDYLEKIFNIPFALPDMSPSSFRDLLSSLARDGDPAPAPPGPFADDPASARAAQRGGREPATPAEPDTAAIPKEHDSQVGRTLRHEPEPAGARNLGESELEMLAALAPLVQTPREAKRLVNLYRMIRTTRDVTAASRFLGDDDRAGDYQAVVILLGLLSRHGGLFDDVLTAPPGRVGDEDVPGGLRHRATTTTWAAFVAGIEPVQAGDKWHNAVVGPLTLEAARDWRALHRGLAEATALVTLDDLEQFQLWAPRVARFSFLTSVYAD